MEKIAAAFRIEDKDTGSKWKKSVSLKYQVLCDETSFFGLVKRKKGNKFEDGEIVKIEQKAMEDLEAKRRAAQAEIARQEQLKASYNYQSSYSQYNSMGSSNYGGYNQGYGMAQ